MTKELICENIVIEEEKVNRVLDYFEMDSSKRYLRILSKISDEKKVKIILSLIKEDKLCVCDIAFLLNISIASASHHLRKLYKQDVLDFSKDGKMVYYFIKDDEIKDFFS
ncbi:transcriptional regulator [Streptococcus iniae]|uniref:Transcriptional regulator n=1 Tax=Streptococcus iniae TaxID=1346 RepID=A0A3L8GCU0_STRIN|nr:metalloregulator ArsR/SmtB family transcription factor [Streptococcus iniae]RLU51306.1 transcriptional regulator [Streptococcus iniae]RLU54567.1 transcriptional regulator [Streptococcus iniae]